MEQSPYTRHKIHRTTQAEDGVFGGQQGRLSIATMKSLTTGDHQSGFAAEIIASVDPTATPGPARRMRGLAGDRGGSGQIIRLLHQKPSSTELLARHSRCPLLDDQSGAGR